MDAFVEEGDRFCWNPDCPKFRTLVPTVEVHDLKLHSDPDVCKWCGVITGADAPDTDADEDWLRESAIAWITAPHAPEKKIDPARVQVPNRRLYAGPRHTYG